MLLPLCYARDMLANSISNTRISHTQRTAPKEAPQPQPEAPQASQDQITLGLEHDLARLFDKYGKSNSQREQQALQREIENLWGSMQLDDRLKGYQSRMGVIFSKNTEAWARKAEAEANTGDTAIDWAFKKSALAAGQPLTANNQFHKDQVDDKRNLLSLADRPQGANETDQAGVSGKRSVGSDIDNVLGDSSDPLDRKIRERENFLTAKVKSDNVGSPLDPVFVDPDNYLTYTAKSAKPDELGSPLDPVINGGEGYLKGVMTPQGNRNKKTMDFSAPLAVGLDGGLDDQDWVRSSSKPSKDVKPPAVETESGFLLTK